MALRVEPLQGRHDRSGFSCGVDDTRIGRDYATVSSGKVPGRAPEANEGHCRPDENPVENRVGASEYSRVP